jgi:hypothetical protein
MELGITAIENLTLVRKPFKMEAIYFITPTYETVNLLVKDYADINNPQYSAAHIFFNNNISDQLMRNIKSSTYLSDNYL